MNVECGMAEYIAKGYGDTNINWVSSRALIHFEIGSVRKNTQGFKINVP